jgi:uncharacterized membrane protein (UPF0136 family)
MSITQLLILAATSVVGGIIGIFKKNLHADTLQGFVTGATVGFFVGLAPMALLGAIA